MPERRLVAGDRFVELPAHEQGNAEIVVRRGKVGLKRESLPVFANRFVVLAERGVRFAEIESRCGKFGLDGQRRW